MKMFDAVKTRMIVLPYGEKNYDDMLSSFHRIPQHNGRIDREADGDRQILILHISMLTHVKNCNL